MKSVLYLVLFIVLASCTIQKIEHSKLLGIHNIGSFFGMDSNYDLNFLISYQSKEQKRVKSISIYRFSSTYQTFLLDDSILLNKNGKPVVRFKPIDHDFSRTFYFYDKKGNNYLDITIGSNNYDTTYTLYKFDQQNHVCKEISYNISRKEMGRLFVTDIKPITDKLLDIHYEFYETNFTYKTFLPFETRNIRVQLMGDSVVKTSTHRIVQNDTTYNSDYTSSYKLNNNRLFPTDDNSILNFGADNPCFVTQNSRCDIKRNFSYYGKEEKEITHSLIFNPIVLNNLKVKIDTLPVLAWKNYRNSQKALSERREILTKGELIDSIQRKEGKLISEFTPPLWYLVDQDSGVLKGIENKCVIAGYNTPVTNNNGNNARCLAIFEHKNGGYVLRKQSFGALEDFIDNDNDLLFDGYNEKDFFLKINDGNIEVNYNYMRGEASYVFTFENGYWTLLSYGSTHRTCCQAETYSYDYKTKMYSFSNVSMSEETSGDTSINVIQERPVIYMDSLNVRSYDFNETGLMVK